MLNEEDCYMLGANFHTRKFKALFNVSLRKEEEESEEDFEARKAAATAQQAAIEENFLMEQSSAFERRWLILTLKMKTFRMFDGEGDSFLKD